MQSFSVSWRAGVAAAALVSFAPLSVQAADSKSMQKQLDELQQAVAAQKAQLEAQQKMLEQQAAIIEQLKQQQAQSGAAAPDNAAALAELQKKFDEQKIKQQDSPKVSMSNGRPTISSADGRYTFSPRAIVHMDVAKHDDGVEGPLATDFRRGSQGATGNRETNAARDFSDGAYFRRARMGFEGTLARDFDYRLLLELGGSGTEGPTRINDAFITYTGFAPFRIQLGAFSPPSNMDDGTGVDDFLFIERATSAEMSRSLAGADGRLGLGVRTTGKKWMGALTVTSRTVNDPEVFDSQLGTVGRFGYLLASTSDYNVHVGASGSYVFQPADQGSSATGARYAIRLRDRPEIRVDSTRLIDSNSIDADSAYVTGVELGANFKNYYFQAENFWYGVERRAPTTLDDPSFGGYYLQGSWIITGESRRYNLANGSFAGPKPLKPFSAQGGGMGAFELGLRFSHTDLNFHEGADGAAAAADSVRGGVQDIWTLGLNWYPNTNLRFMLNFLHIDVNRLNPAGPSNPTPFGPAPGTPPIGVDVGQDLNVYALRSQFSF
jgi:phosphate-selective porin OprO/OprP